MNIKHSILVLMATGLGAMTMTGENPTSSWGVSLSRMDTTVNTWNRDAVVQLFRDGYVANHWLTIKDTGADWVNGTTPGTMDEQLEKALIDKVNCLRHLTGISPVTEITEDSYENMYKEGEGWTKRYHNACARLAAFVEAALYTDTGTISHYPDATVRWYSEDAAYGASHSLLAVGTGYPVTNGNWPDPIQQWCWEGIENTTAGHMLRIVGDAETTRAYIATCPFNEEDGTASSSAPRWSNSLSSAMITTREATVPYDCTVAYEYAYPSEGYFPKGFIPTYWTFRTYGKYAPYNSNMDADAPLTVTIKKNGVALDGVEAWFMGGNIIFSVPTLTNKVANDYYTATDGLRQSVLKDDLGEAGDVTYEVSITLKVISDDEIIITRIPNETGGYDEVGDYSAAHEATYTYTVVTFDWPAKTLTYQVFPDEYQVGYNWKYTSWLGYYYTAGSNWIYSLYLNDWLYVYDAGNFGQGGNVYTSEVGTNGKIKWDVPTAAEANYGFWAWRAGSNTSVWIKPERYPTIYDYTQSRWVKW